MTRVLCVTVRFLSRLSHGRGDGGASEWPPSPLRLFQALAAGAAGRWNERRALTQAAPALEWLERLPPPAVVACPASAPGDVRRHFVPTNVGDLVGRAWASDRADDIAHYRTAKDSRPLQLGGDGSVRYLYDLTGPPPAALLATLVAAARSMTHLGRGVDVVVGDASLVPAEEVVAFPGEWWRPSPDRTGHPLRVPAPGTLEALHRRHHAFLTRLADGVLAPVPALARFETVGYRRDTDPAPRAVAAFELLNPDLRGPCVYEPYAGTSAVAGMVRHAVAELAAATKPFGWGTGDINTTVHGHSPHGDGKLRGGGADERFAFLPLASVEGGSRETIGGICRALVVAPPGRPAAARWARLLSASALRPLPGTRPASVLLIAPPLSDWTVSRYLLPARVWTTVTPVLRPGYDDRNPTKAEKLLRTAFIQAGYRPGLVDHARLEWQGVGFVPGVGHVRRYALPEELAGFARLHVRVTWPRPIPGPIAVGAGRYRGFGVFVSEGWS